ncbi:uncharacterized protein PHACADRAFT_212822 [Phanerochaete carnosa HHB-10118-sp]|uniref:Uncharacterized protein n=1 Tax=Phanerochaete carnosa (strain HHB-10118-sp) TaxID=650164 RepID=K5UMJ3_PHACS|nr:uncharacterized protein PHACADRAFT_212822 [Phanerochaete carnosa HHB-10118-sp]EKM50906.1 hypothetical protein PHACADRAFT_212822 [Phanerochaete carnosa HHB-10118-sp]
MYAGIAERVAQNDPPKAASVLLGAWPTWTETYAYRTLRTLVPQSTSPPPNASSTSTATHGPKPSPKPCAVANQRQDCIGSRPTPDASSTRRAPSDEHTQCQAERPPHPGPAQVYPTSSGGSNAESRMADSANPDNFQLRPFAQRAAQPYVYKFLRDIFPPLSAPGVVRQFIDAGMVERKDLVACSRLPESDQLQMLRSDLGLNILHSRMVIAALRRL